MHLIKIGLTFSIPNEVYIVLDNVQFKTNSLDITCVFTSVD